MAAKDKPMVTVMRELSSQYPRHGYRADPRLSLSARALYVRRHGLSAMEPSSGPSGAKKAAQEARGGLQTAAAAGTGRQRSWAYDFVFDACANGQQLKCLTIIDEYTHESLAIDVAGNIRSGRVIEVLSKLISERGAPKHLRSDNGPEFVPKALLT